MAECHQWCNERELGQISGDDEGQGGLAFCSPWDCKESDTTGQTTPIRVHIYIYIYMKNIRLIIWIWIFSHQNETHRVS